MRARLLILTAILIGAAVGLAAFTFVYARGYSYLTNDPAACANCHVMDEHYDAWEASSHHTVAACNDCHTPHDNLIAKYWVKSRNGFWHSFYFTTGDYPYPLRITRPNQVVVESACRDCHAGLVVAMNAGVDPHATGADTEGLACTHCHRYVGHWVR